ncbi:MAG: type VII toxin-antitoxin system HepT family RNase toxin [Nocardioidaceae bacterium]
MSPRELDPAVVQSRLRMIQELLDDLASVGEPDAVRLEQDRMLRHAVERILSQIVELAVSVNSHVAATHLGKSPKDYRSSFNLAESAGLIDAELAERLQRSVGLRNVLTHEYVDVDLAVVAASVGDAVDDYGAYANGVAQWIERRLEVSP